MKKFLVVIIVLMLATGVAAGVIFAINKNDSINALKKVGNTEFELREFNLPEGKTDIKNVEVLLQENHIKVVYGDTFKLSAYVIKNSVIEEDFSDGNFFIRARRPWYKYISLNWGVNRYDTVLTIPKSFAGSLKITTDNYGIDFDATSNAGAMYESVALKTANKDITAKGISAKTFLLETANGTVLAENIIAKEDFVANSVNGKIDVKSVASGGTASVRVTNGKVFVKNLTAVNTVSIKNTNGTINVEGVTSDNLIVSNISGIISVSGLLINSGDISNVNGDINLEIDDSYYVSAQTMSDKNFYCGESRIDGTTHGDTSKKHIATKTVHGKVSLKGHC